MSPESDHSENAGRDSGFYVGVGGCVFVSDGEVLVAKELAVFV